MHVQNVTMLTHGLVALPDVSSCASIMLESIFIEVIISVSFPSPRFFMLVKPTSPKHNSLIMSGLSGLSLVQCILCRGSLPGVQDEVFLAHMRDQHRAYFNLDFMFAAFFLTEEKIGDTLDFMNNNCRELKPDMDEIVTSVARQEKFEGRSTLKSNKLRIEKQVSKNNHKVIDSKEDLHKYGSLIDDIEDGSNNIDTEFAEEIKGESTDIKKAVPLPQTCEQCEITFKSKKQYKYHKGTVHRKKALPKCEPCNRVFINEKSLQKHLAKRIRNHTKTDSNMCPDCGKYYNNKYYLTTHRRYAHDDEIHVCDLCSREVKGAAMLRLHKRRFHKEKQTCSHCGVVVKKMKEHMLTKHTNNDEKRFICQECGKGFITKYKLQCHVNIHSDQKPFVCRLSSNCGKAYADAGNRLKHEQNLCKLRAPHEDSASVKIASSVLKTMHQSIEKEILLMEDVGKAAKTL